MGQSVLAVNRTVGYQVPEVSGRHRSGLTNGQLGMLVFVCTEVMFFIALISAYLVIRAAEEANWLPPYNLRLPVEATGLNTAILVLSGLLLGLAFRHSRKIEGRLHSKSLSKGLGKKSMSGYVVSREVYGPVVKFYTAAAVLGGIFVSFQGFEWVQLIGKGMTMHSGLFGATFFLLIGMHGFHALLAVLYMGFRLVQSKVRGEMLTSGEIGSVLVFWAFVVGIWPFLYGIVYF